MERGAIRKPEAGAVTVGKIAELCVENELDLHVLAAWTGMLYRLLAAMDEEADSVPLAIRENIEKYVGWREREVAGWLEILRKNASSSEVGTVLYIKYENESDVPDWDIPPVIRKNCAEYAKRTFPANCKVSGVPFDHDRYFKWLGGNPDTMESRNLWSVYEYRK